MEMANQRRQIVIPHVFEKKRRQFLIFCLGMKTRRSMLSKMPTAIDNNRGRSLPLSYRIFSLVAVVLISLMVAGTFFALAHSSKKVKADNTSFGFSYTGDYDQTTDTTKNLQ